MAQFDKRVFSKKLMTMLHVDFRRIFTMLLIYIMVGACLVMLILILVIATMMDGSVTGNPRTGVETVIEGFDSSWQIIGTASGGGIVSGAAAGADATSMGMSMIAMCNINLLYFFIAVLVCLFMADDFAPVMRRICSLFGQRRRTILSQDADLLRRRRSDVPGIFVGSLLGGVLFSMGLGAVSSCVLAKHDLL